ncbi:MAG: Trk system potassium transporter TrkA [Lachnospiraceae bacterium]|nr:Trk system potassium transporter TrkA [Eubacterium sp.]MBQ3932736.1 Trk system potassium transporter TrkA [Lachnospiraceae bacterium]
MNIIIAGCGKVGTELARQLDNEDNEVTVIDTNMEKLTHVSKSSDVIGYQGDCTGYHTQLDAGIEKADLMIAVTDQDEKNMLACLIARKAGKCKTIARVRNPQYSDEIEYLKEELGLSMSVNPERAAAEDMVRLLRVPSALDVDTFAKGKVNVIRLIVPEESVLNGLVLKDIGKKIGNKGLICIAERDGNVTIPSGDFVLQAGDRISVAVALADLNEFLDKSKIKTKKIQNVLIAGGGMMSYYLAKKLISLHVSVKIIEKNKKRCEDLAEMLPKAMIINGDATDRDLLIEESIDKMDAVCALMDHDEENILLSLYVSKVCHAKLLTRMHRNSYEDMVGELPVGNIISTKKITAEYILRFVRSMQNSYGSNVEALYRLADNKAEALEFTVGKGAEVTKAPIKDLNIIPNTLICSIIRKGVVIRPGGNDHIHAGDSVVVVTTNTRLNGIDEIIRG